MSTSIVRNVLFGDRPCTNPGAKNRCATLAAARVQRWALIIAAYRYNIEYKCPEQHVNADGLSSLSIKMQAPATNPDYSVSFLDVLFDVSDADLKAYCVRRDELTVENYCVLWGLRAVVPVALQGKLLKNLHENHWWMVKMKALTRSHFLVALITFRHRRDG